MRYGRRLDAGGYLPVCGVLQATFAVINFLDADSGICHMSTVVRMGCLRLRQDLHDCSRRLEFPKEQIVAADE